MEGQPCLDWAVEMKRPSEKRGWGFRLREAGRGTPHRQKDDFESNATQGPSGWTELFQRLLGRSDDVNSLAPLVAKLVACEQSYFS